MKAVVNEYSGCFEVLLEPESLEDQARLIRMGLNATKEVRSVFAACTEDLTTYGCVVLGRKKNSSSYVKSRRER